ncbi:MAG: O-antigen ligase family protein [Candidatus Moranbacteria bacterium]|nr:O-antigen ligase family protein [Candidatus Moranbacteria bacterium]
MSLLLEILLRLVFLSLPLAQVRFTIADIPIYVPEALVFLSGIVFLFGFRNGSTRRFHTPFWLVSGILLLMVGAILTAYVGGADREALGAVKSWIVFPLGLGFLLSSTAVDRVVRHRMITWWFFGIVVVSAVSFFGGRFSSMTYDGRLSSFYPSPNHLAMFLEAGIFFGTYLAATASLRRNGLLAAAGTILISVAVLRTGSEGAYVAILAGFGFLWLLSASKPRRLVIASAIIAVLVFGATFLFMNGTVTRLGSGEVRNSVASRVMIWNAAGRMIVEHPITGIGLRNFEAEYLALQPLFPRYLEWAVPHPNNVVLSVWLGTGLLGLSGFAVLTVGAFRVSFRILCRENAPMLMREGALYLAVLVAFVVHGSVDTPLLRNDLSMGYFALLGMIAAAGSMWNPRDTGQEDAFSLMRKSLPLVRSVKKR